MYMVVLRPRCGAMWQQYERNGALAAYMCFFIRVFFYIIAVNRTVWCAFYR